MGNKPAVHIGANLKTTSMPSPFWTDKPIHKKNNTKKVFKQI
jgi:hypothetical protein